MTQLKRRVIKPGEQVPCEENDILKTNVVNLPMNKKGLEIWYV